MNVLKRTLQIMMMQLSAVSSGRQVHSAATRASADGLVRNVEESVWSRHGIYRNATRAIATVGFAVISIVPLSAADVTNTVVVATSNDAPPQGAGELADLEPPVLGNGGMAAFAANIRQGITKTGSGIFLGDGTHLLSVALEGNSTPNQDGEFGAFTTLVSTPRINAANQVAFRNSLGSTAIQGGGHAIFVADPLASQIRELARSNSDTPVGSGTYENTTFTAFYLSLIHI